VSEHLISVDDAERVWRDEYRAGYRDQGSVEIGGRTYGWWADLEQIWFYNDPDADGTDTFARFDIELSFSRASSSLETK